jgi:hypothetical protein
MSSQPSNAVLLDAYLSKAVPRTATLDAIIVSPGAGGSNMFLVF